MAKFMSFYTLNTAEQLDLFLSKDGKLDLFRVMEKMSESAATFGDDNIISGEGFFKPSLEELNDIQIVKAYSATQGSLGNYREAYVNEDVIKSQIKQHKFYSKSSVIISENSDLILIFDDTSEERTKTKVKSLIESLGFEASFFRIDDGLLRILQSKYKWLAAKLEGIERIKDSTKKVSYEIDPTDEEFQSEADKMYKEHGKMSHLKFEMPYDAENTPNTITVKLYNDGHRIVIDGEEFPSHNELDKFILFLYGEFKKIKS